MKKFLSSLSALALAVTLTACSGGGSASTPAASDAPVNDGPKEITVTTSNNGWDLSPFGADTGTRYVTWNNIYDVLCARVEFGDDVDDLEMDIAKSVKISDDGLTAEIEIYDYVKDSKGNPITAKDVEECYNYAITLGGRSTFTLVNQFMESIKATGDYTLTLKLKKLSAGAMATCLSVIPICNWEWFNSADDVEKTTNPACTGPYYIDDMVMDSYITLKKSDYWQTDDSLRTYMGHQPFDTIYYKMMTEPSMRTVALENKEVDAADISAADIKFFMDDNGNPLEGYNIMQYAGGGYNALMFNCAPNSGPLWNNKELRQAICYAIDNKQVMYGADQTDETAHVLKDFCDSIAGDYLTKWDSEDYYDYNLDKAKELFAQSGYKPGELKLRLQIINGAAMNSAATVIQNELAAIGIDVEILPYDLALFATYKMDFTQWDLLMDSYSTKGYLTDGWNRIDHGDRNGVDDPKLQELFENAMYNHTDADLDAFHQYLKEQAYAIGLYAQNSFEVAQDKIVEMDRDGLGRINVPAFKIADDYATVVGAN
ncbi:MAG: ABC transporter substrate-binding protein [Solobacterium sp.]|nr:ABC transporter substrate-binding protein [Solobacterium sp.]